MKAISYKVGGCNVSYNSGIGMSIPAIKDKVKSFIQED
jgi:hypothetical protein